ncbi:MAG: sigma-70 family RNA polymerase sigma factor [Planctomycetota bacterium]
MRKLLRHDQLDARLAPAAAEPTIFPTLVAELVREFDAENADLEIRSPSSWRRGPVVAKNSFVEQFRADVDSILPLDREEEAALARRIDFARARLDAARLHYGLEAIDPVSALLPDADAAALDAEGQRRIQRRTAELHALRTEMVERNLYLVLINVERYAQSGGLRGDLVQEGSISLFRAVDGFDWTRGWLFRTYAVHWLNQAFRNYLYNHGSTVRVPVYLQKAMKHVAQEAARLEDPNATPEEIARNIDLNENLVAAAMTASRSSFSIDAESGGSDDGSRLRDMLIEEQDEDGPYSTDLEDVSLEGGLASALERLSDREQHVLVKRFGLGGEREHTLAEVAKELGVSVERVRQIQVRALAKLDTPTLRKDLDPFLN